MSERPKKIRTGELRGVSQISVLVCDAQLLFAQALSAVLRSRFDLLVPQLNPTDATDAVEAAEVLRPDVVVLDYWLPGQDPLVTVQAVLKRSVKTKVILLSSLFQPFHIEQALQAGAAGFLPRSVSIADVAEAVRRGHSGEFPIFASKLKKLVRGLEARRADSEQDLRRLEALTDRERAVLQLLTMGRSVQEIADQMFIARKTVNNHIHRILRKSGAASRDEVVVISRNSGWAAPPPSTQDFHWGMPPKD